jgi:uncharacterized protein (DUF1499 family)
MWLALYIALGLLALLVVAIIVGLVSQVEDWGRDLSTNVAVTEENAADRRLLPIHSPLSPTEFADHVESAAVALPNWALAHRDSQPEGLKLHFIRTTPLLRFKDDIRVTIAPVAGGGSVLSAESRSRIGKGDLGQNPRNLRELLASIRDLVESRR